MRRLVIRPGAIGDSIVSLPAVERLRPAEIWAPARNLPLFAHLAPVRPLLSTGIDSLALSAATLERLGSFDEIVSWYGENREEFRAQVRGLPFTFLKALPPAGERRHAADFYLEQVGAPPGAAPGIPVPRRDGGFAVIHPFSGSARKNWPLERFREVAARLPVPVRWCAGPEEPLEGAERFGDLGELARWLAGARVYVGNDSGITHLAAACGVPVVAVFGPTDACVWAPRGERVTVAGWDWTPERVAATAAAACTR